MAERTGRVVTVTSPGNPLVKTLRGLHDKKGRRETGLFLAEGLKLARDAADGGWRIDHLVVEANRLKSDPAVGALAARVQAAGGTVVAASPTVLAKISRKDNPQMVVAAIEQRLSSLEAMETCGLWVVLEEVRDPGNLGTVVRTADAAGDASVVMVGTSCDPFSPEAVRATMGSLFHVPLARATAEAMIDRAARTGRPLIGTHLSGAVDYRDADYPRRCAVVMGNEQAGLSETIARACRTLVRIPMREGADSLNLAVATGLMIYEARRASRPD